jgi:hypothetical protein
MTALDDFFTHYYARRPVNATFTGVHAYDEELPDWSVDGLAALDDEMRSLGAALAAEYPAPNSVSAFRTSPDLLDAELARGFLEIQRAENASMHGPRGNPALWTGEAVFSIIALMIREFSAMSERIETAEARLAKFSSYLCRPATQPVWKVETKGSVVAAWIAEGLDRDWGIFDPRTPIPLGWKEKALRDRDGAMILFTTGMVNWFNFTDLSFSDRDRVYKAAVTGRAVVKQFTARTEHVQPDAPESSMSCGPDLFDLLLTRGHFCARSRSDLLAEVKERFEAARAELDVLARSVAASWPEAQARIADDRPAPDEYYAAFERTWQACYEHVEQANVISWPDNWPIEYVSYPAWTAEAAPHLYYLHYRSPAPFDPLTTHEYVVPPLPIDAEAADKHLRVWNNSTIKLNHVVHHGAIGHHVQNWYAYNQQRSRVGQVAGVDCANRIGMFCGGTMTEGWACYATDLMEELGFFTPLERVSQQHTRVRMLARAIVDIELHQGSMSFAEAVAFYISHVGMGEDAARNEAVKNSMYPCTAIMYWLGTQTIHDLRDEMKRREGPRFSLRRFHGELLGYGSIPVPLLARMMTAR